MNLKQLSQDLNTVARRAGAFIKREGENFDRSKIEMKGFNDLVSYVDKEAEKQLVEGLRKLLPEAGFVTEEGTDTTKGERYNWIIDPLDGTTNFTHGVPVYCVSVALIDKEELIAGAVYDPNHDNCFWAYKGGGAFCNDTPIKVSDAPALKDSLIATGFPYYDFGLTQQYLQVLGSFMAKSHGIRRLGSAAMDLVYVATGHFEGFFEYNLNPWDVAAGALIVLEAGGKLSKFTEEGDYLFGREIVASNGHVHAEMQEVIKEHWKPTQT
ncbi:myo-inositol-1(or 4)-monophosphatase [Pontibacter ummariensis]|uniref:Inositol-1-monophosphatase n=1 Tax=Pontibacter ummariensis TaxID=1610492 RepID=A0A239CKY7_9BACT|nr:inositol monophosphatase family protein [Pontibacter ummariensis]PRY14963.1 myo-inositol-1(or 4)-monophosphatase [Pontibacter ummariensis]SNS20609.1 myo-inositol-1(or 4)-monophosphatase [Pontibacter ummariensis]